MVTRLYFHNSDSSISGTLPSAKRQAATSTIDMTPQTTNKSMNTTIGTTQTSIAITPTTTGAYFYYYGTRFLSQFLNQTGITANTWTLNYAIGASVTVSGGGIPVAASTLGRCYLSVYVWRPSTGAVVGDIFNGTVAVTNRTASGEKSAVGTFAGSAVASATTTDIIVCEIWIGFVASSVKPVLTIYYDGTTVTTATNTAVTNHAAFIETPENLSFSSDAPASINMTPNKITLQNKFITKI
jgi:hypothetical protein